MDIAEAIAGAAAALETAGVANARLEAASLIKFVLGRDAAFLIAHPEYRFTESEQSAFAAVLGRRTEREPLQYITGRQEFYGLEFEVTPGVLIPRPETEILVEDAVSTLSHLPNQEFLEIGVGSGCISVSILHSVPTAVATGVDISPRALDVAGRNARKHAVADRLTLIESSLFDRVDGPFSLIVSNPPYVPDEDLGSLQPEVRDHEPSLALAGGPGGIEIVREIISSAPRYLRPGGSVLIEIGFGQSTEVERLFEPSVWTGVDFLNDLAGIPRIARARLGK